VGDRNKAAATTAANPPLNSPGERVGSQRLRVVEKRSYSLLDRPRLPVRCQKVVTMLSEGLGELHE
jgi:hypothetical protein